jgi:hypothetical protein
MDTSDAPRTDAVMTADEVRTPMAPPPSGTRMSSDRSKAAMPATTTPVLTANAEPVRKHVKPLLTFGTDVNKAADGFNTAEQFVTVAYAAKNTEVPFVLLKHRVLNEDQSLAEAIRASKPDLDASLEAERARIEARADLARINGD